MLEMVCEARLSVLEAEPDLSCLMKSALIFLSRDRILSLMFWGTFLESYRGQHDHSDR